MTYFATSILLLEPHLIFAGTSFLIAATGEDGVGAATAAMPFSGPAMIWLESGCFDLSHMEWDQFCSLVCDQFEHNEYNSLSRQLFHLR